MEESDQLIQTLSKRGTLSVRAIDASRTVTEASKQHKTSPLATIALGRALMAALLLAGRSKTQESIQLSFEGVGSLKRISAIADDLGNTRGFVSNPRVGLDDPSLGLSVGKAIGGGTLSVIRLRPNWKEPYTGIVLLESGEIAEDIARYLLESEQIPSVIALGVHLRRNGEVASAAGFLAQALPGFEDDEIQTLEANASQMHNPSQLSEQGMSPYEMCKRLLQGLNHRDFHHKKVQFHCNCSLERAKIGASLLPKSELIEMVEIGENVEIRCEFCTSTFSIDPREIIRRKRIG